MTPKSFLCRSLLRCAARASIFVCWLFALMVMPTLVPRGLAQGTAAPAKLSGVVRDPTGALVPGAKVQLERAGGVVIGSVTTDSGGRFQLALPLSGDYELLVACPGFSPLDRKLHVAQTPSSPLTLTMALASVADSVTVSASDVDVAAPDANKDAATITADDVKNLPIFDGDIVAALAPFLDAGVAGEGGTTLMVDGVESSSLAVATSAIQSVTTNEDPYSAEYRQPGRGQVEIITKSTADHFHGEASFTYRNSALNGTNYFATVKPSEDRRLYEGYLTGPIKPLRDTAFLFSMSRKERNVDTQVLATTLPTVMPEQNVPAPTRTTQITMKVSRQYNDHHSAYVLYTFEDDGGVNQNVGALVQASAGYKDNDFDQHEQSAADHCERRGDVWRSATGCCVYGEQPDDHRPGELVGEQTSSAADEVWHTVAEPWPSRVGRHDEPARHVYVCERGGVCFGNAFVVWHSTGAVAV